MITYYHTTTIYNNRYPYKNGRWLLFVSAN